MNSTRLIFSSIPKPLVYRVSTRSKNTNSQKYETSITKALTIYKAPKKEIIPYNQPINSKKPNYLLWGLAVLLLDTIRIEANHEKQVQELNAEIPLKLSEIKKAGEDFKGFHGSGLSGEFRFDPDKQLYFTEDINYCIQFTRASGSFYTVSCKKEDSEKFDANCQINVVGHSFFKPRTHDAPKVILRELQTTKHIPGPTSLLLWLLCWQNSQINNTTSEVEKFAAVYYWK